MRPSVLIVSLLFVCFEVLKETWLLFIVEFGIFASLNIEFLSKSIDPFELIKVTSSLVGFKKFKLLVSYIYSFHLHTAHSVGLESI